MDKICLTITPNISSTDSQSTIRTNMTPKDFETLVTRRLNHCQKLLTEKGEEYSRNGDRLWNFHSAAATKGTTPEDALMGMLVKHWVSIMDMVSNPKAVTDKLIDDKLSDNINYSLLLEALFKERINKIPMPTEP